MTETVKIGSDTPEIKAPLLSESISIQRPSTPGLSSQAVGINIMNKTTGIDNIKAKLLEYGINPGKILYFNYSDGSIVGALLYCTTAHGHHLLVELPPNTTIYGGDLSLTMQRVGVLPTSTIDRYAQALKDLYTGYAYVCAGGIHYVRGQNQEPILYGYSDYQAAQIVFDIKKYHYILLPTVAFNVLVAPSRLNTIEAYINMVDRGGVMKEVIQKAGLIKLFTLNGPMTIFMPNDQRLADLLHLDPEKLRATILAHVVQGRIDSQMGDSCEKERLTKEIASGNTLTDPNQVPTLVPETLELVAVAQNKLTIQKLQGKVIRLTSAGQEARPQYFPNGDGKDVILTSRYNGILYRIDSVFSPVGETFKMPEKSDLDDVVTIFDIAKSTMEIRRAQYTFNIENQHIAFETLEFLHVMMRTMYQEINQKSDHDGVQLIRDSVALMNMFYSREVPCSAKCEEMDKLAAVVRDENAQFEKLLRISNRFAALKVPLEEMLLKMARIDQKFHVAEIVREAHNPDFNDDEDDDE